jgi:cytosine/adenosine deaminase-related metal-dependent hydrolase
MIDNSNTIIITDGTALLPSRDGFATETCDITIEDGVIARIDAAGGARIPEGAKRISARERLICPGFVNAHTHSPLNMIKGTTDRMGHVEFMWTNQADTAGRSDEEIYVSAVLGCLEMIRTGTTAAIDHYPEQNCTAESVAPAAHAYADAGFRAAIALRVFDRPYRDIEPNTTAGGEFAKELAENNPLVPRPADERVDMMRQTIARWHRHMDRISIFPGPSNPARCSDELLIGCHALAEEMDTGVHTHLLETEIQRTLAIEAHGHSIVAHLHRLGVLDKRWSFAHTVWVDDADIELLAAAGPVVVHNPESNAKLGVGVAPIAKMLARGVNVALGTDGSSTNDNQNMFDAMSLAVLLPRIVGDRAADNLDTAAALRMATTGGARAMHAANDLGEIAVGLHGDLVMYDLRGFELAPLNDAVQQLVFSERGASVRTVLIGGEVVYDEGRYSFGDADAIVSEALRMRGTQKARNADLYRLASRIAGGPA